MKKPSQTRQRMLRIQNAEVRLAQALDLGDVYALLNQLSEDVYTLYPQIACPSQCAQCCYGHSMPVVTAAEWVLLYTWFLAECSASEKQALYQRLKQVYQPRKEYYWQLHSYLQNTTDLSQYGDLMPRFSGAVCPFLIKESCSVYPVRPAKCRAHGAFLQQMEDVLIIHACESEVENWEKRLKMQGTRQVLMPFWNPFEEKLKMQLNPIDSSSTVLVLWLLSHYQGGDWQTEPNPTPDFISLEAQELNTE